MNLLLQVKLEDVFRSTQQSMDQGPGANRVVALALLMIGALLMLLVLYQRRRQGGLPSAVHHPAKLVKEMSKAVALKPAEVKQLRAIALEHPCESPLTVLLCPSILSRAIAKRPVEQRKHLASIVKRMGRPSEKQGLEAKP